MPVLAKKWSGIFDKNGHTCKSSCNNNIEESSILNGIFFNTSMHSSRSIKLKLFDNSVNRIHFLSNGINESPLSSSCNSKRNARETSSGTHIKICKIRGIKVPSKKKRIKKMKNNSFIKISNTREIDIGINLLNVEKMQKTILSLLRRKRDIKASTDIKELLRQNLDLLIRILKLLKDNRATRHSYSFITND